MKIIELITEIDNESNGVANSAPSLTRAIQNFTHDIQIYTFSNKTDKWNDLNVKVFDMWHRLFQSFQFSPSLYSSLKKEINKIDIIHCHGTRVFPFVAPFYINRSKSNCKIVVSPRGSFCDFVYNARKFKKFISSNFLGQSTAMNNTDMFHATSYQEYQEIRNLNLRQPVVLISNGIALIDLTKVKIKKRKSLLFLSRIDPKKNIESLLEAWSVIEPDFVDWELNIVGRNNNDYSERLKQISKNLGNRRVNFLGEITGTQKYELMANCSLFILPSYNENFGNVIAESLMCETPVITTKGTPWESVISQKCGWWIDSNKESFEKQLRISMSLSLETLHQLGKNGRSWMEQDFSWETKGRQMLEAYQWIYNRDNIKPNCVIIE